MFLHLIIAAALLTPGTGLTAAAAPTAAMVCSIAAEFPVSNPRTRRGCNAERGSVIIGCAQARPLQVGKLTTQLRR